jgi:hypothetical protein
MVGIFVGLKVGVSVGSDDTVGFSVGGGVGVLDGEGDCLCTGGIIDPLPFPNGGQYG